MSFLSSVRSVVKALDRRPQRVCVSEFIDFSTIGIRVSNFNC